MFTNLSLTNICICTTSTISTPIGSTISRRHRTAIFMFMSVSPTGIRIIPIPTIAMVIAEKNGQPRIAARKGTYDLHCSAPFHEGMGMKGEIRIL